MEKLEFPRVGEQMYHQVLDNGLHIFVVPKPGFQKSYAFFATNYGGMDMKFKLDGQDMDTPAGVAHYLEHKMFDTKEGNALQELAANGASPNAVHQQRITGYYFESTEKFEENLRILLSFVSIPYFTKESVDKEQKLVTLKLEEGEIGAVAVGDICMGIFHDFDPSNNATADSDDGRGNRTFAGFATVYFRITEVLGDRNEQFRYELRPLSATFTKQIDPMESMTFVAYGSFTNTARRSSRYSTRTYQRYLRNVSDWEFTAENIAAQFGDLTNLSVFGIQMSGYSALSGVIFSSARYDQQPGQEGAAGHPEQAVPAGRRQRRRRGLHPGGRLEARQALRPRDGTVPEGVRHRTDRSDGHRSPGHCQFRRSQSSASQRLHR